MKKLFLVLASVMCAALLIAIMFSMQAAEKPDKPDKGVINTGFQIVPLSNTKATPAAVIKAEGISRFKSFKELLSYFNSKGLLYDSDYVTYGAVEDSWSGSGKASSASASWDAEPMPASPEMRADGSAASSPNHSETNSQVEGVTEGDIVKTDGKYIYSYGDDKIIITKINGADMKVVGTIPMGGSYINEMYVAGDSLVTVGSRYEYFALTADAPLGCIWNPSRNFTEYKVFDITDRSKPYERRSLELEGNPVATRMVGGTLYFVCTKYIYGLPLNDIAEGDVLPIVRDTAISDQYKLVPAKDIYYFTESDDHTYMFIGSMDISSLNPVSMGSYVGAGRNIYMSLENLYIISENWRTGGSVSDIYRFSVGASGMAFEAKGSVPGSVLNQYSMDEYNGVFRVATTVWDDANLRRNWNEGFSNAVFALDAASMKVIGKVENLAKGETIQSARFMGDMAYLVTFFQTDPLFVIDMSDPRNPKVKGELKIPGFSSYLHPAGDGLLIGFGRDVQETFVRNAQGVEEVVGTKDIGSKISLFDVSNPYSPKEIDVMTFAGGFSEAETNPRAMMVDRQRGIFGFVMNTYDKRDTGVSLQLVTVRNGKLVKLASIKAGTWHSWNERLCYSGDTLYHVQGSTGIYAYSYSKYNLLGEIKF